MWLTQSRRDANSLVQFIVLSRSFMFSTAISVCDTLWHLVNIEAYLYPSSNLSGLL